MPIHIDDRTRLVAPTTTAPRAPPDLGLHLIDGAAQSRELMLLLVQAPQEVTGRRRIRNPAQLVERRRGLDVVVVASLAGGVVVGCDGSGAWHRSSAGSAGSPSGSRRARARRAARIRLVTAPRRALVGSCQDAPLAAQVESGGRTLHAGERLKCAVR